VAHTRQQYGADYYSGANITISAGPSILTQAFGINYSVEQMTRPIYGYNSQYFDAAAKGIVQVNGTLYVNFVSPRYLTVTIHHFYQMMHAWRRAIQLYHHGSDRSTLTDFLENTPVARNLFLAMTRMLNVPESIIPSISGESIPWPNQELPWSYQLPVSGDDDEFMIDNPEQAFRGTANAPDLGVLLEDFYANESAVSGLTQLIWGDDVHIISDTETGSADFNLRVGETETAKQWSMYDLSRNTGNIFDEVSSYGRPDQMGHPIDGIHGLDITIAYGNPFEEQVTNTTFQYDHGTSRVIKGVRFTGESTALMANDEPILDIYPFIARSVHALTVPSTFSQ